MDKNIPTKEYTIGKGAEEKKILVYEWMTNDEESRYQALITGDKEFTPGQDASTVVITLTPSKLFESRKLLIESMCKDLKWEDFNEWRPSLREELYKIVETSDSKK